MPFLPLKDHKMPARRQSEDARQYVYRIIKACILELFLLPGEKLNEAGVASTLSVSRTPVHDTFIKLSRESLVDIIPQRGAFVSRIHLQRIDQAVWLHQNLGTAMLHNIFVKNVSRQKLEPLYSKLNQIEDCLLQDCLPKIAGLICDFYHQLYLLGGEMEFVWEALQKADVDLRRLLQLSAGNATVAEGFLLELTGLADALAARDNDKACRIYAHHLSRLLLLPGPLEQHHPEYFIH